MTAKKATPAKKVALKKRAVKAPAKPKATAKPKHPLMIDGNNWSRDKVMDIVCERIASSSKSITSILAMGFEGWDLPSYVTFTRWLDDTDEACNKYIHAYARAKLAQMEFMGEEMAELHEKAWVPVLDDDGNVVRDKDGSVVRYVDKSSVAACRLEADNKKWLMSKLMPKKYGDKVDLNHGVQPENPLTAMISRIGLGGSKLKPIEELDDE